MSLRHLFCSLYMLNKNWDVVAAIHHHRWKRALLMYGAVAQLVERHICNVDVWSSNLHSSTKYLINNLN